MRWSPVRGVAVGGILFGIVVLFFGILFLLVDQRVINIQFGWFTVCSLGLILLGIVAIGGTIWGVRMARGGWRRWIQDWEHEQEGRGPT